MVLILFQIRLRCVRTVFGDGVVAHVRVAGQVNSLIKKRPVPTPPKAKEPNLKKCRHNNGHQPKSKLSLNVGGNGVENSEQ